MLTEAIRNPGIFDSQLYVFETVGTLLSLLAKLPEQQSTVLLSVITPLMNDLSVNLQSTKSEQDFLPILKIHHTIMALGNIAKGFPDYPSPVPEGYTFPPLDVFAQISRAILMCLEAMSVFKVVRDAVCILRNKGSDQSSNSFTDKICFCTDYCDHWSYNHALHTAIDG